jgi:hypothetical protein
MTNNHPLAVSHVYGEGCTGQQAQIAELSKVLSDTWWPSAYTCMGRLSHAGGLRYIRPGTTLTETKADRDLTGGVLHDPCTVQPEFRLVVY